MDICVDRISRRCYYDAESFKGDELIVMARPRGCRPGGSKNVPHSEYAAIVLMDCLFDWTRHDIGDLWGIKGVTVRAIIRRWQKR